MESGKREFKSKDRMSVELNHYLKITRSHVHQIYRELESSDKVITVDLVRKLYYGLGKCAHNCPISVITRVNVGW